MKWLDRSIKERITAVLIDGVWVPAEEGSLSTYHKPMQLEDDELHTLIIFGTKTQGQYVVADLDDVKAFRVRAKD